jgi:hypothetical protein
VLRLRGGPEGLEDGFALPLLLTDGMFALKVARASRGEACCGRAGTPGGAGYSQRRRSSPSMCGMASSRGSKCQRTVSRFSTVYCDSCDGPNEMRAVVPLPASPSECTLDVSPCGFQGPPRHPSHPLPQRRYEGLGGSWKVSSEEHSTPIPTALRAFVNAHKTPHTTSNNVKKVVGYSSINTSSFVVPRFRRQTVP